MATLNLPTSTRTKVWRVLKAALEADTAYADAGVELRFFDGDPGVLRDLDPLAPVLLFWPTAGPVSWFDERSSYGALAVDVMAVLSGLDAEDAFDLQQALELTLNSLGDLALQSDLVEAEAVTGLVEFKQPLTCPPQRAGADGLMRLTGRFQIEVRLPLNT